MANEPTVFRIDSEAAVWEALQYLIADKSQYPNIVLDLSKTDWIKFRYTVTGEIFHHTVTPSIMAGLVDFQKAFYRSIALILHDDKSIRRLTNSEKEQFELLFVVGEGSSDLLADAGDKISGVAKIAARKMTGRQIMICILLLIALYFLSPGLMSYVQGNVDIRKQEIQAGRDTALIDKLTSVMEQGNKENHDLLEQALRTSAKAHDIGAQAIEGYDSVVRHSERADSINVNGIDVPKPAIDDLTAISRRTAKDITITRTYVVKTIDRVDDGYFNLKIEQNGIFTNAVLNDPVLIAKYMRLLQISLTKNESVVITLNGRQIGDDIIGAKIMKTTRIK